LGVGAEAKGAFGNALQHSIIADGIIIMQLLTGEENTRAGVSSPVRAFV